MAVSFLIAQPELVSAAAGNLSAIQSALEEATAAASSPTTGIAAAAADEVSAAIAQLFGTYGQEFQSLSAQATAFNAAFAQLMNGGAAAYVAAEAANAGQALASAINAPGLALGGLPWGGAGGAAAAAPAAGLLGGLLGGGGTTPAPGAPLLGGLLGGGGTLLPSRSGAARRRGPRAAGPHAADIPGVADIPGPYPADIPGAAEPSFPLRIPGSADVPSTA